MYGKEIFLFQKVRKANIFILKSTESKYFYSKNYGKEIFLFQKERKANIFIPKITERKYSYSKSTEIVIMHDFRGYS